MVEDKITKDELKKLIYDLDELDAIDREEEITRLSKLSGVGKNSIKKQFSDFEKRALDILNDPELLKKEEEPIYSEEEISNAEEKFNDENLLENIKNEISKDHIGDDNLKMTLFLGETTGLLSEPSKRISMAVTGNSSEGKSNAIDSTIKHFPNSKYLKVTNATQASIEDDFDKPILVFNELNASRENGANKHMVELIKQKTEGGTSAFKKDLRDQNKTTRHEVVEQGIVIFSTTEDDMDEEMKTRFLTLGMKSSKRKIRTVNNNTLDNFSDIDRLLLKKDEKDSFIKVFLTAFDSSYNNTFVVLPYAKYLKDFSFIDDADPRSQRDLKRLLSLTSAMTLLHFKHRKTCQKKGVKILESSIMDLINTIKISGEFFNQSYTGIDSRYSDIINFIKKHDNEWVSRDDIKDYLGKSLNTTKELLAKVSMSGIGAIEGKNGASIDSSYHSTKIYYRTCQKAIKKPLITCQLSELEAYLNKRIEEEDSSLHINTCNNIENKAISPKIDSFSLTGFEKGEKDGNLGNLKMEQNK